MARINNKDKYPDIESPNDGDFLVGTKQNGSDTVSFPLSKIKEYVGGSGGTYNLPISTASSLGGIRIGSGLTINPTTGVVSATGGSGGGTFNVIEVTEGQYKNLYEENNLVPNSIYKISSITSSRYTHEMYIGVISSSGGTFFQVGAFILPKYNMYSLWRGFYHVGYEEGDIVIYGGKAWINDGTGAGYANSIYELAGAWDLVPLTDTNVYVTEYDNIIYKPGSGIVYREDSRGNSITYNAWDRLAIDSMQIGYSDPIEVFQWGNDKVSNNRLFNGGIMTILNTDANILSNTLNSSCIHGSDTNIGVGGNIINNNLKDTSISYLSIGQSSTIASNTLDRFNMISASLDSFSVIRRNTFINTTINSIEMIGTAKLEDNHATNSQISHMSITASMRHNTFTNSVFFANNTDITWNVENGYFTGIIPQEPYSPTGHLFQSNRRTFSNNIDNDPIVIYVNENNEQVIEPLT